MSTEFGQHAPEAQPLPPEWQFLSVENIQELRDAQQRELHARGQTAPDPHPDYDNMTDAQKEQDAAARHQNYRESLDYIASFISPDEHPEEVNSLGMLLYSYGIYNVTDYHWNQTDDPRKHEYQQHVREFIRLHGHKFSAPNALPAPVTSTEQSNQPAPLTLEEARLSYAHLRLERRRQLHSKGKRRQKLAADYEAAAATYKDLQLAEARQTITELQAAGHDDAAVKAEAVKLAVVELHELAQVETDILQHDTSRRGRLARFLAKSNRRFFASSFAAGAAGGAVARLGLGKVAGGTVGSMAALGTGVGIGIGMALGTTRAAITSLVGLRTTQITEHSRRHREDTEAMYELHERYGLADTGTDAGQYANFMFQSMHDVAHSRIAADQRHNRHRVARAAIAGAIGGAAAVGLIEFITSDGPTVTESTPDAPPVETDTGTPDAPAPTDPSPEQPPIDESPIEQAPDFNPEVKVEAGHGYTQELQDLAGQQDIALSGQESYEAYLHLAEEFKGGHFFTDVDSFTMENGDFGIAQSGNATWNPAVMEEFQRWLIENEKTSK